MGARRNVVEADEVNLLAASVLRDFEQIENAQEA
jgi:hypothetical protein